MLTLKNELHYWRTMFRHGSKQSERMLRNLLAVIHRDGGQYVEEHGLEQAVKDAEKIVAEKIVV